MPSEIKVSDGIFVNQLAKWQDEQIAQQIAL